MRLKTRTKPKAKDQKPKADPKQKTHYQFSSGFVEIVLRSRRSACQRRKQVQRPATDVVVMPKPSVAVNVVSKHDEGLYRTRAHIVKFT
jgi:hypothetical protein